MKRVLIPGVILCGADVAQAVDDKNMYMHVFEEMTVYAPVPVPVNGNTHYTSESIERLPTGNGNISDLLRTNPAVRMDSTQSTSLNQGDIRPEKISIHGASPYQNAYLIDGISATNNLNPANESDASSATNISGMSQGYYLDVSLLDNVTLYDSFVPVEFGRFNGGVIDAKIKRFNADDSNVKLGYRTTRSDWLTSHIDENNKSAFNQGSSGSTYYSPDFKKNFYSNGSGKEMTEKFLYTAISQLDNLLRLDGVKSILCNRHNNIDLDKALANSELIFVCTRRGDLGATSHKIFGLFFLIAFENAVLRRPGTEKSRTPYFLYIDEFPDFINKATEPIFTMFRKYKVGATISAQNLSQLNTPSSKENFRQTILANCANKIFTGNGTNEDLEWWSTEMGQHREWSFSDTIDFAKGAYDSKHGNVSWKFVANFSAGKLQSFSLKDCAFKLRSESGKPLAGQGKMGFLDSKYKEPQKIKKYDFAKFSNSADLPDSDDDNSSSKKEKFNPKNLNFLDDRNEFDPVQTDTTDSKYLFDNEDAIVVNFKNKKKDN